MSFNIDDPLAGILSDGSDDSFFDDDILGKKKPTKKKETPTAEKKNALFDLGDRDKEKPRATLADKKEIVIDSGYEAKKSPTPFKRTLSKESMKIHHANPGPDKFDFGKSPTKSKVSASVDKLDILDELTDTKATKVIEKGKSSQSLIDDILGGSSTKTGGSSQAARPVTAAKSQEFDFDSILGKTEPNQFISNKNVLTKPKENTKAEKEPAPSKKKSNEDWLGIFEDKDASGGLEDDTGMPSWLTGGNAKKKKQDEKKPVLKEDPVKEKDDEEKSGHHGVKNEKPVQEMKMNLETNIDQLTKMIPSSSVMQGSKEDITAGGAGLYLQQQESQLMVALQLKAQEEKLAALQMRQKETQRVQREAALAQHAQLDDMLRRQAENRQQMQSIITAHQERITQRIKALLGTENTRHEDNIDYPGDEQEHTIGENKETPYTREKKQLLQLVQSLQENHDKEIDLMETSYRRQLAFLEVSLNQSEERMKEESDKVVRFYSEKIHWLEEHHQLYKKLTEDNLMALSERHKAENQMLRQQHLENIKVLQEHHATLMENIKNAVKQEQILIQDSAGFSSDLKELVADVKESKNQCHELIDKVTALSENTQRDTDRSIQTRESQINEMIQQLKRERENFEIEKTESRDLVKMLETRLKQMTTMIEEESAAIKQKRMEFEFEKATFNKQTEFAKNVLKKQDEEIKMLREDIQKEYQEKTLKIDEEKSKAIKESAALAKEKSSILNLKQELEKMKAELQAQLEDATEERSKLNVEKQEMHMEEQRILAKSRDLDLLAKTAIEKQSQADKKYSEAEFIQRKYEERIRRIQEHVVSLNSREKQIAKEKVALSRERLNLHNERKQIESRQQCSLCKSQNITQYYEPSYTMPESLINAPVSRDYRNANVNSAMSAIEQEMAHLMGRNLNFRHSTEMGVRNTDETFMSDLYDNRSGRNVQTEATPVESGAFKDYMDPKFMMLRLDVQKVLSNMDQNKKDDDVVNEDVIDEE